MAVREGEKEAREEEKGVGGGEEEGVGRGEAEAVEGGEARGEECSGPTGDPGRLGMARANCSWPGIYSWPGCGGPTLDLQLAWLWMA